MSQLQQLEIDYVRSIAPEALAQSPRLELVRIHGTETWEDSPPRVPKGLFRALPRLGHVEIRNFRWPPVLEVHNREVVCRTRA